MVKEKRILVTPLSIEDVKSLRVGDVVYLSGLIVTARDKAHKRALEELAKGNQLPVNLEGGVVFHCGPLMKKENDTWKVVAAGPTTSARMEKFEAEFIKKVGVRAIIGKGGMGKNTLDALKEHGCVYLAITGGCAVSASNAIKEVKGVYWYELGMPEALWLFKVEEFGPLVVGMDSCGNSLYEEVYKKAKEYLREVVAKS